jgi:hypothetical protein
LIFDSLDDAFSTTYFIAAPNDRNISGEWENIFVCLILDWLVDDFLTT